MSSPSPTLPDPTPRINSLQRKAKPRRSKGPRAKKNGQWGSIAHSIASRVAELERVLNPELKYFDTTVSVTLATAGAISALSLIDAGDAVTQRNGESIKVDKVEYRLTILPSPAATVPGCSRVICFQDTDQNGTLPTLAALLISADAEAQYNYANVREGPDGGARFKILYDKVFACSLTGSNQLYNKKGTLHPNPEHLFFTGTGSAQASQLQNNIYLCYFTDVGANPPSMVWTSRILFFDN
jgi:hypothetical protein